MVTRSSRVVFQFTSKTTYGEKIKITGNHASLGNWDPKLAPFLTTDPNSYPMWVTATPISLPVSTEIEYKYVYVRKSI